MPVRSSLMSFAAGIALVGLATFSGPAVLAQDATPEAVEAAVPRPVHIHTGNCANLGEVVQPQQGYPRGERHERASNGHPDLPVSHSRACSGNDAHREAGSHGRANSRPQFPCQRDTDHAVAFRMKPIPGAIR